MYRIALTLLLVCSTSAWGMRPRAPHSAIAQRYALKVPAIARAARKPHAAQAIATQHASATVSPKECQSSNDLEERLRKKELVIKDLEKRLQREGLIADFFMYTCLFQFIFN